jgi:hypothetical protein
MSPQSESQEYIKFECRMCEKKTNQIERIVTDMLPPNVKTLQCCICGAMSMCLMDGAHNAGV